MFVMKVRYCMMGKRFSLCISGTFCILFPVML